VTGITGTYELSTVKALKAAGCDKIRPEMLKTKPWSEEFFG